MNEEYHMTIFEVWSNAYIYNMTDGRCYVERVRVYEHERNDAMCEVDWPTAQSSAVKLLQTETDVLLQKPRWDWESPKDLMARLNG